MYQDLHQTNLSMGLLYAYRLVPQLIYCCPYSSANLKSSLPQLTFCFFFFMHFIFICHSQSKSFQIRRQDCYVLQQLEAPKIPWKFVHLDSLTHLKNCPSFVKAIHSSLAFHFNFTLPIFPHFQNELPSSPCFHSGSVFN